MSEVKHSTEKLHVKQWKISVSFFLFCFVIWSFPQKQYRHL